MSFVKERFCLNQSTKDYLYSLTPNFGYNGYGELVYRRTYSRIKKDGRQEDWHDTVIRIVEGTFSIRKDWYTKNYIEWDEQSWQMYAEGFAKYMFNMYFLPPGRGAWAMGTDFVYNRGSMALYNCAMTYITDDFSDDFSWMMDCLMHGVGVGFRPIRNNNMELYHPKGVFDYVIEDTRESWVNSVKIKLLSYQLPNQKKPNFIYDKIRGPNLPINGFGGLSSGPEPLKILHKQIEESCEIFKQSKEYDCIRFKADIGNQLGCCVCAGNLRRSAELLAGNIDDQIFLDLKNYDKYPERSLIGWMSNNSAILEKDSDFLKLGEIAKRVTERGEPGILNVKNFKYGRVGQHNEMCIEDKAIATNPCIVGDTKVYVADSRGYVSIKELADAEKDIEVFCINEYDELDIRVMRNPRKTGENKRILKIILDDGNYIRVTENHKIMLRDRSFIEANKLNIGDSVALINRYFSGNYLKNKSTWEDYIRVGYGQINFAEHRLIAEYNYGPIDDDEHVHHKDENKQNNDPKNLEVKDCFKHLSDHNIEEENTNWSGYTNQDLLDFGIRLCKKLGRRFSLKEFQEYGPIKAFSGWRKSIFGSMFDFGCLCADLAEVKYKELDPRIVRSYQNMLEQGYEADIIDNDVYVYKICEACKKEFKIYFQQREQASCSLSCNNLIRDYSKNFEGQRKTFAEKRETLKEKQLDVYAALKLKLGKVPQKKEWITSCKEEGLSCEIGRSGSPFKSWFDLKYAGKDHNHRVAMIIEDGYEDVYNGTVDDYHNFIIGGWIDHLPSGRKVERGICNLNCGEIPLEHREVNCMPHLAGNS